MPLKSLVTDPGSGRQSRVDLEQSLRVSEYPRDLMPSGTPSRYRYYRQLLGSTGAGSGTTNQNVNGSSTAQEFYIEAASDHDICFMTIVCIIADTAVDHNSFGNVNALGNGWDLKVTEAGIETFIIEKATTGGRAIAQAGFYNAYGNTGTSFELTNWNTSQDATSLVIPVGQFVPGGIRLGFGTKDRLQSVVNDNLTGLTEFLVYGIGYRHYNPGD